MVSQFQRSKAAIVARAHVSASAAPQRAFFEILRTSADNAPGLYIGSAKFYAKRASSQRDENECGPPDAYTAGD